MRDETKANLTSGSTWIRLVHMIVLVIAFNIAELIIGAVVVLQFLSKLLTGNANEHMKEFGAGIGTYLSCIVRFLIFESEEKPFPYAPWAAMQTRPGDNTAQAKAKTKRPRRRTPAKQSEPSSEPDDDSTDTPAV